MIEHLMRSSLPGDHERGATRFMWLHAEGVSLAPGREGEKSDR